MNRLIPLSPPATNDYPYCASDDPGESHALPAVHVIGGNATDRLLVKMWESGKYTWTRESRRGDDRRPL
jgi:hypothetical protein